LEAPAGSLIRELVFSVVSAVVAVQSSTSIDAGPLHVAWSAPQGCPQASDALARVQTLLGAEVGTVLHQPLEARAVVTELGSGRFRLDLEMRQGSDLGARSIEADSCQEVAQAGALVIALTIDPELLERRGPQQKEAGAPALPDVAPGKAPSAPVSPSPPRASPPPQVRSSAGDAALMAERTEGRRTLRFGPGLSLLGDAGSLPGLGAGPEFDVHAQWRWLRTELGFVWLPARRGLAAGHADVGGSIRLLTLAARGCAVRGSGVWTGGACIVFELGSMHATAFGAAVNGSGDISWISPGLGLTGGYSLFPGLSLRARIEALVPLDRSEFILENVGPVHEPSQLVGRLSVGLDADFW
jgi:hypothetical protein